MKVRNESLVQNVCRSLELIAKRFSTPRTPPDSAELRFRVFSSWMKHVIVSVQ